MKKSSKLFLAYGIIGAIALGGIIGTSISIAQQQKKQTLVQQLDNYQLNKTASLNQNTLASIYATNPLQVVNYKWDSQAWSKELKVSTLLSQKDLVDNEGKKPKNQFYLYNKAKPLAAIFTESDYALIQFKSYANDFEGILYLEVTYPVTSVMKQQDPSLGDTVTKVYSLSGFNKITENNPYQYNNTIAVSAKSDEIKHDFDSLDKLQTAYNTMVSNLASSKQPALDRETWFRKYFDFNLVPVTAIDWNKTSLTFTNNSVTIQYTYGYKVLSASVSNLYNVEKYFPNNGSTASETFNNLFTSDKNTTA
ncbi:MAG1430 family protein [Mycoplasma sp. 005V]|uniref:MAG1430 family protein n=1 Tax=unclassified Mycoplasma TaxID=2683645 RepID=UPI003A836013